MTTNGYAVRLCITTECESKKVVIIMWINVVVGVEIIALFVVPFGMFIMGLLKIASIADDQSERWLVEHRKDNSRV